MPDINKYNNKILKYLVGITSGNPIYFIVNINNLPESEIAINNGKTNEIFQVNFDNKYIYFTFFENGVYEKKSVKNMKDSRNIERYFKGKDMETRKLGLNLLLNYFFDKYGEKRTVQF